MNKQILGAKKAAEEQSKPYKDRVAKLERELKDFVTEHRADMGKTKTRALTFGEVGFRPSIFSFARGSDTEVESRNPTSPSAHVLLFLKHFH